MITFVLNNMGTPGYWAIVYKGKVYLAYNHWDSYPELPCGLGSNLVMEILWGNLETWKWALDQIKHATGTPTDEDKKALRRYTDLKVSYQSDNDWRCLTWKCQGSIVKTLQSGYFHGQIFPFEEAKLVEALGSLQWGYVVDFDRNEFRTFARKEIHFWRFQLDAIPQGTFSEASILAFNRISDGNEFPSYHESGDAIVEAYKRYVEEEKNKANEKKRAALPMEDAGNDSKKRDGKEVTVDDDSRESDAKKPKTTTWYEWLTGFHPH